jgi:hypothetical protein
MTSDGDKAIPYFRDLFPELSAMPDAVLAERLEKLWASEKNINSLAWLDWCDAVNREGKREGLGDSPRDGLFDGSW